MSERNDRTFELVAFLQDGFAPQYRKAKLGASAPDRNLDWAYRLIGASEMLAWLKLGETIGYFPRDSAERIWVNTRVPLAKGLNRLIKASPHLQKEADSWSVLLDITGPKFWNLFSHIEAHEDDSERWPWFRTQLLLAQRFGRSRPAKILIASLISLDDDQWCSALSRSYDVLSDDRTRTKHLLNEALLSATTDLDQDVGRFVPQGVDLVAGFFLTLDQMILANNQTNLRTAYDVDIFNTISWIRRCRLNFESDVVLDRFFTLLKLAEIYEENIRSEEPIARRLREYRASFREALKDAVKWWTGDVLINPHTPTTVFADPPYRRSRKITLEEK